MAYEPRGDHGGRGFGSGGGGGFGGGGGGGDDGPPRARGRRKFSLLPLFALFVAEGNPKTRGCLWHLIAKTSFVIKPSRFYLAA